jgi:hypothetical protein
MEDHDGSAVHDEAHLTLEGAVEPLGEIGEDSREELACERDLVHFVQPRGRQERHQVGFGGITRHLCEGDVDGDGERVVVGNGGKNGVESGGTVGVVRKDPGWITSCSPSCIDRPKAWSETRKAAAVGFCGCEDRGRGCQNWMSCGLTRVFEVAPACEVRKILNCNWEL